jgi:hypothetical protein
MSGAIKTSGRGVNSFFAFVWNATNSIKSSNLKPQPSAAIHHLPKSANPQRRTTTTHIPNQLGKSALQPHK